MPKINNPHPDFDLGVPRGPIDYNIVLPSHGCDQECGLIFYIHGYGASYDDEYTRKLLRYFSDKYNCIACCVDYFGARCFVNKGLENLHPNPLFFSKLKERYGLKCVRFSRCSNEGNFSADFKKFICGWCARATC